MGIVSISDTKGSRGLSWSGQSGRQYSLEVLIVTDDPTMGPRALLKNLGIKNGDNYQFPLYQPGTVNKNANPSEYDLSSFVQSLDIKEEASDGKQWRATIQYGPFDWTGQGGYSGSGAEDSVQSPFAIPPQVRWSSAKYEQFCNFDNQGKKICNTAGDPFDPTLKRDDSRPVLTVVQNQEFFDIGSVQQYKDAVNSDVFLGFVPNTVKCQDITAERMYSADWGYYWQVTYVFEIRPIVYASDGKTVISNGWTELVLNAGTRELKMGATDQTPILINGAPITTPVLLSQSGQSFIGTGVRPVEYYVPFNLYPQIPFAGLPIDQNLLTVGSSGTIGGGS